MMTATSPSKFSILVAAALVCTGAMGAAAAMLLAGVAQGLVLFWRFSFLVREDRPQEAVRHAI